MKKYLIKTFVSSAASGLFIALDVMFFQMVRDASDTFEKIAVSAILYTCTATIVVIWWWVFTSTIGED